MLEAFRQSIEESAKTNPRVKMATKTRKKKEVASEKVPQSSDYTKGVLVARLIHGLRKMDGETAVFLASTLGKDPGKLNPIERKQFDRFWDTRAFSGSDTERAIHAAQFYAAYRTGRWEKQRFAHALNHIDQKAFGDSICNILHGNWALAKSVILDSLKLVFDEFERKRMSINMELFVRDMMYLGGADLHSAQLVWRMDKADYLAQRNA